MRASGDKHCAHRYIAYTQAARNEELDAVIAEASLTVEPIPREALFLAGKAFLDYRRRRGSRHCVLPDFYCTPEPRARGSERGPYSQREVPSHRVIHAAGGLEPDEGGATQYWGRLVEQIRDLDVHLGGAGN